MTDRPISEGALMRQIMVALAEDGHIVFRANVGKFKLQDGRWFDTGLPPGFSDLFGICTDGRPLFIEVKTKTGRVSEAQWNFLAAMLARGARAGVARSIEDALRISHQ
jgi:hypothetical protein